MSKKVSIIMPCYNGANYLQEAVNSVINQTYDCWELIIVDDCSSDNTYLLMVELASMDDRIIILKNSENQGGARTRNTAIGMASGRYIAFLDSDDVWGVNKLTDQVSFMESKGIGFSYTNYQQFSLKLGDGVIINSPSYVSYVDMIKCNFIGCLTVMYDVTAFGKFYFPLTKKRHDFALWLEMLGKFDFAYNVGSVQASYRVHSNSLSANKLDAFQSYFHVLYRVQKIGVFESLYSTFVFAVLSILKKKKPAVYLFLVSKFIHSEKN